MSKVTFQHITGSVVPAFACLANNNTGTTMVRLLTLSIFCGLVLQAVAQLSPRASAPLAAHMLEVNRQWQVMDPQTTATQGPISFANDAERIAMHLHLVRHDLLQRMPEGLSAASTAARYDLLERLGSYASAARFPRNHALPHRNPVFIDPYGTACAVGWLMIESGHRELAESIATDMNLAYVLDMPRTAHWPAIAEWASEHGFTADELAWIQPGYMAEIPTFALGGGTNGPVQKMMRLPDGDLLLAGTFTEAGTVPANGVATWDGATYTALGNGIDGEPLCAAWHDGQLYLGGTFEGGLNDLAIWNGTTWNYQSAMQGMSPRVNALYVHDGTLYAAGEHTGFAMVTHEVRRLVDGQWEPYGDPFNDQVLTLSAFQGELVAGGAFTQPVSVTDPLMLHVARHDGFGWAQFGDGLDAPVHALLVVNDTLHAGGAIVSDQVRTFGLARIAPGADNWERLIDDVWFDTDQDAHIATMADSPHGLVLGGDFDLDGFMYFGAHMAFFHGTPNILSPGIVHSAPVATIEVQGNTIHYGGYFDQGNFAPLPHAAWTNFTTGMDEKDGAVPMQLHPNPADEWLGLSLEGLRPGMPIRVVDASGREVRVPAQVFADGARFDVHTLTPGSYMVLVTHDSGTITGRFVRP
jgi:hypothetical protein